MVWELFVRMREGALSALEGYLLALQSVRFKLTLLFDSARFFYVVYTTCAVLSRGRPHFKKNV